MLANTCEASAQCSMSRPCKSFPLTQSSQRGRCQKVCFIFFDSCVNIFARSCLRNVCEEMSKVKIFQALYSPTHTLPSPPPRTHTWHILEQIDWTVCLLLTSSRDKALSYLLSCTDYVKQKCVKLFKRRLWITVNIGREIKSICRPKGHGRARGVKGSERSRLLGASNFWPFPWTISGGNCWLFYACCLRDRPMRETDASLVSCLVAALVFFDKFTISLATLQAAALLYVLEFRFSFFFYPLFVRCSLWGSGLLHKLL